MSHADPLPSHELAAFAAAVEAGTVHGAAEALNLTQSAATKRIRSLERRVGGRLLERSRRGVEPTGLGRLFYAECKHVLAALDSAERAVNERARVEALRLAASQTTGEFLLPGWLSAFRALHPGVRAQLAIVNSPAALRAVLDDRAEIGFVEGTDPLERFEVIPLREDEIVAVVGPEHRWARRHSVPVNELEAEPFVTRESGSGTRAVAEHALAHEGVTLQPDLELASTQSLKRAVVSGGFTLLSRITVEAECESGTLVARKVDGVDLHRVLSAVRRRDRSLSDSAEAFWTHLSASAKWDARSGEAASS